MGINEKLKEVYRLYVLKDYKIANDLNDEILALEPNNIYAKRYVNLLSHYLKKIENNWNLNVKDWKNVLVKWKKLLCPKCSSWIRFSWLNQEQKTKIKNSSYSNLELKCPYCHSFFVLQKKRAVSLVWIKLWDKLTYNNKKYRVVWYVEYKWKWYDDKYSWFTTYLEWMLLWEDNSYLYFSEWYFLDEWKKEEEFDFSYKVTPDFVFVPDYSKLIIEIWWKKYDIEEYNKVDTISLYWENSKSYKVWEKVILYYFTYNWKKYILEREWVWRQSEAWLYITESVNIKKVADIFWIKLSNSKVFLKNKILWLTWFRKIIWVIYFWILLWIISFVFLPPYLNSITNYEIWKNYYIKWEHVKYNWTTTCSEDWETWTCYWYTKTKWIAFSIKDEKDLELLDKLKTQDLTDEKLKKIFSWKSYTYLWDYTTYNSIFWSYIFWFFFIVIGWIIMFSKND